MPRETKQEKAQRLVNDGRVVVLSDDTYGVHGDTSRYLVALPDEGKAKQANVPVASCTCEHRDVCSHLLAARAVQRHVAAGGTYPPA